MQLASWFSQFDGPNPTEIYPIVGYRPLIDKYNSVILRIVRRGDDYFLQARLTYGSDSSGLLDGIEPLRISPPGSPLDDFQTLGSHRRTIEPKAMGLIVKTAKGLDVQTGRINDVLQPMVCDAAFRNIAVLDASPNTGNALVIRTDNSPPMWEYSSAYGYDSLPTYDSIVSELPVKRARISTGGDWLDRQWLHIRTRYLTLKEEKGGFERDRQEYRHSQTPPIDEAPKVLTKVPPSREFAVATSARIDHSSFCPWMGGVVDKDVRMWGKETTATTNDIFLSPMAQLKKVFPDPEGKYIYKVAFIIVARKKTDISGDNVRSVDVIRHYWDAAFELVTRGRRYSNSNLS